MRICTLTVPNFRHGGLDVGVNWQEVDVAKLDEKGRNTLRDYVGKFIQIHPADVDQIAKLGLALNEEGRLVEPPKSKGDAAGKSAKTGDDKSTTNTGAPKGDAAGKSDAKKE